MARPMGRCVDIFRIGQTKLTCNGTPGGLFTTSGAPVPPRHHSGRLMQPTCGARLAIALMALGSTAPGCHHAGTPQAGLADPQAADSVVGRVQLVGVAAAPRITLVPSDSGPVFTLAGPLSLRKLDGLRVAVVGPRSGSELHVIRFTVVAANGLPATDGRLVADGRTLYLETADRVRHRLVAPSPRLWEHVGGRVWVSGPLDREPVAYGVIE